jgi:hypothetical protein
MEETVVDKGRRPEQIKGTSDSQASPGHGRVEAEAVEIESR